MNKNFQVLSEAYEAIEDLIGRQSSHFSCEPEDEFDEILEKLEDLMDEFSDD